MVIIEVVVSGDDGVLECIVLTLQSHIHTHIHNGKLPRSKQVRVQYLAQGHFDMRPPCGLEELGFEPPIFCLKRQLVDNPLYSLSNTCHGEVFPIPL